MISLKKEAKGGIYIQQNDISFILEKVSKIPSIVDSVFRILIDSTDEQSRFVGPFYGEAAKWIDEQDYVIDFGRYEALSSRKVRDAIEAINKAITAAEKAYSAKDEAYRTEHKTEYDEHRAKYLHARDQFKAVQAHKAGKKIIHAPT